MIKRCEVPGAGCQGRGGHLVAWLALTLVVVLPTSLASQTLEPGTSNPAPDSVARLWNPNVVQQRAPTTDRDNDSTVKAIEGRLRCTCGCNLDVFTCRTTDFTCATSPAMHRLVLARLDSAMTAEQVVDAFVAQYGMAVLMAPPKSGFNWTAYIMPFVGLGLGLALVVGLMRRWIRSRPTETLDPPDSRSPDPPLSDPELERLRRELEHFEA